MISTNGVDTGALLDHKRRGERDVMFVSVVNKVNLSVVEGVPRARARFVPATPHLNLTLT